MVPLEYVIVGSKSATGTITQDTLTAAYSGNYLTVFSHGLQQLHLDFTYTPKAGQTDRYMEVKIENLDEFDNIIGSKSVLVPSTSNMAIYSNKANVLPIKVPGEGNEISGTTIKADMDINIDAYKIKISARENGNSDFGTTFISARLSELK